jgi:phage-related protein
MREVKFLGDSRAIVRSFPELARSRIGFQLGQVQRGLDPDNWKPMKAIGTGVREIRVRDENGAFRLVYVASMGERIYVLHAFQKKSQATLKRDIELARARYKMLAGRT